MNDTINELTVTKSLKLLRDGFKHDLATCVYADPRMTDLLVELCTEFVEANIPVIDEENRTELTLMMMETLDIIAR